MRLIQTQNFNKKLHIYLGLFLVFFIWLFSLSGLILNHGNWKFASFWEERLENKIDFKIHTSVLEGSDLENAHGNIAKQDARCGDAGH